MNTNRLARSHDLVLPDGWPGLPGTLAARAITEHRAGYAMERSSYMSVGAPALIIKARTEQDVQETVLYAARLREQSGTRVEFSIRSGGHGIAGTSTNTGGIILDLSALRHFEMLDPQLGLVRVGAGATWGQIAGQLAAEDLVISSGNFGDTGVGGLATAGGVGYFARSQGLTLDSMVRAKLVTADGTIRWVDTDHESELFWAVRGDATHAGVVTAFEFTATDLRTAADDASIIHQQLTYLTDSLPQFTADWGQWVRQSPDELGSFLMVQALGDGQHAIQARNVWAGDGQDQAAPVLREALGLAQLHDSRTELVPYPLIVPAPNSPHAGQQRIKMRDVLVDQADEQLGAAMAQSLAHRASLVGELRALGGAVARVPAHATAWGSRHQEVLAATWIHPLGIAEQDQSFAALQVLGTGAYGAYSSDVRRSAAELAWPGQTGTRLRALSERTDPQHLFDGGLNLRSQNSSAT
ncbi:FAD-binding oxidoreductase [Glutamicibacter sp. NPDC055491]